MPHPKNHMKLTGDTHPPEVGYDLDELDDRPSRYHDGYEPLQATAQEDEDRDEPRSGATGADGMAAARAKVAASPLKMVAVALAVGFVLARLFR
jgi:hypothetical protein